MKTLSFKMGFMMALVIGTTAFVSCSSDDEDGSSNGSEMTSKRIAKITGDTGYEIITTIYGYDSQGRVIKIDETDTYGKNESTNTTTYTYGENTIISKESYGDVHTYTLSNGRIVKDAKENSHTYSYTYDSNGYVTSQSSADNYSSGKIEFTWTDGNLTKFSKFGSNGSLSYTYTISYSDISWPQNWMHYWKGTNMDKVFEPLGAWGKMPKKLPTKLVRVYDDGETDGWTIDYTIEKGEITKTIFKDLNDDSDTEVYTIEWK